MAIVIDASAAVELVLGRSASPAIARRLLGQTVLVPAHFDAEVYAAIRRAVRRHIVPTERGSTALLRIASFDAERIPLATLLASAFAERDRFGAHDVFYAVLARRERALLVTVDEPFARGCEGFIDVELAQGSDRDGGAPQGHLEVE